MARTGKAHPVDRCGCRRRLQARVGGGQFPATTPVADDLVADSDLGAGAGASAGPAGAEAAKPADDNVVDAEVKEVKKG